MGQSEGKPIKPDAAAILTKKVTTSSATTPDKLQVATFGAGCFWGVELIFQRVPGVVETQVGYCQGRVPNPSYEQVCSGSTGHVEAVQMKFDGRIVKYEELLQVFWNCHDPTQLNRQGGDTGTQYRSGIYVHSEAQMKAARESRSEQVKRYEKDIATEILSAETFYPAETYHQQYLEKGGQCARKGDLEPIRCYG